MKEIARRFLRDLNKLFSDYWRMSCREMRSMYNKKAGNTFTCGSNPGAGGPFKSPYASENEDYWQKRGKTRHCSYCGCLHPEDVKRLLLDGGTIDTTTKNYKLYINHKDIHGAGKIYSWHNPGIEEDIDFWDLIRKGEEDARARLRKLYK